MVGNMTAATEAPNAKMNHKKFRSLLKKFRRKFKRQAIAKARDEKKEHDESCSSDGTEDIAEVMAEKLEEERERQNLLWLEREKQACEKFEKKLKLEEFQRKREEEIMKQKEELTTQGKQRATEVQERKDEVSKLSVNADQEEDGPCFNPVPPANYNIEEKEKCLFFQKTGCCRFGDRCSRSHPKPDNSDTILIKGMYSHFSIEQMTCDDYDADTGLEYEDNETYLHFCEFYEDVLPEFKKVGRVRQFKVCCNHEPHLRGNVYIQFSRNEEAEEAFRAFNSRWYGGKQLSCEFTEIRNWKSAICGLFHRNRCPKGSSCNFLHVFKNPGNEFWAADQNINNRGSQREYRNYHRRSPAHRHNFNYHSPRRHEHHSHHKEHYVRSSSSSSSSSHVSSSSTSSSNSSSPSRDKKKRHKKYGKKRRERSKRRNFRRKRHSRTHSPIVKSAKKRRR